MMRIKAKQILLLLKRPLFLLYSGLFWFIFFVFIFILSSPFMQDSEYDQYIEQTQTANQEMFLLDEISTNIENSPESQKEKYEQIINDLRDRVQKKEIELTKYNSVLIAYYPAILESYLQANQGVIAIREMMYTDIFYQKHMNFLLEFHKKKEKIRGKFYNNTIQMYGISELNTNEVLSVFIHELGHYFDITYLEKKVLFDVSDMFYNLSWDWVNVIKSWLQGSDFVSGYAMTNKYEDFAESFTYYILFNDDFREKATKSEILYKKYNFFSSKIFRNDEFKKTNFRVSDKLEDYYWDTTKIKFSLENFLEYLKK